MKPSVLLSRIAFVFLSAASVVSSQQLELEPFERLPTPVMDPASDDGLLAYLMADPELSLQSILMITAVIGRVRTWTYVGWVAVFSTLAGLIYGSWVDGASVLAIGLLLAVFLGTLSGTLWWIARWNSRTPVPLP